VSKLSERAPTRTLSSESPRILIHLNPPRVSIVADDLDQEREAEPLALLLVSLLGLLERERKVAA
jgi:hypothetical protein